mmetsp:Transcript_38649/g.121050  ORF Transcript_38649/g.121050 Transcript_38649/m.121050 type:complete len:243 (+) Transcript_38649:97-825(+)
MSFTRNTFRVRGWGCGLGFGLGLGFRLGLGLRLRLRLGVRVRVRARAHRRLHAKHLQQLRALRRQRLALLADHPRLHQANRRVLDLADESQLPQLVHLPEHKLRERPRLELHRLAGGAARARVVLALEVRKGGGDGGRVAARAEEAAVALERAGHHVGVIGDLLLLAAPERELHHAVAAEEEAAVRKRAAELLEGRAAHVVKLEDIAVLEGLERLANLVDEALLLLLALLLRARQGDGAVPS